MPRKSDVRSAVGNLLGGKRAVAAEVAEVAAPPVKAQERPARAKNIEVTFYVEGRELTRVDTFLLELREEMGRKVSRSDLIAALLSEVVDSGPAGLARVMNLLRGRER